MGAADGVRRFDAKRTFQWRNEGGEKVEYQCLGLAQPGSEICIDQGGYDYRLRSVTTGGLGDAVDAIQRLFQRVDEGDTDLAIVHTFELRQQTVRQGFGGDASAVRDDENGTFDIRMIWRGYWHKVVLL